MTSQPVERAEPVEEGGRRSGDVHDASERSHVHRERVDVPHASGVYRAAAGAAFGLMRLQAWRIRIRGLEHIPRRGGAVIVANHTSFWDFFASASGPYLAWQRPVRILAKASLFDAPLLGPLMRRADHIPVHRASGARALASAVEALRRRELVLVLPEQTISPSFELLPFKRGAIRMATAADVPLIPTVSWGSHRFHTVGRGPRWSWRLPVTVRYGEPVHPTVDDDPDEVGSALRTRMRSLLEHEQRAYPDGTPSGAWWVPHRLGGSAPTVAQADAYVSGLEARWQAAAERFRDAREQVRGEAQHAREKLEDAREQVQEQAHHARERLRDGVDQTRERIGLDPGEPPTPAVES